MKLGKHEKLVAIKVLGTNAGRYFTVLSIFETCGDEIVEVVDTFCYHSYNQGVDVVSFSNIATATIGKGINALIIERETNEHLITTYKENKWVTMLIAGMSVSASVCDLSILEELDELHEIVDKRDLMDKIDRAINPLLIAEIQASSGWTEMLSTQELYDNK